MIRSLFNVHTGRSCVSNFVNSVQERPELSISYSTNQWQLRLPNRNAKWKPWVCELKLLIGSLATNYIRAVSEIPDPALQVKSTNRNYALPAPAGRIYRQVPTIIGHINAADLPLPPRPLAGKYAGQTFSTPNDPSLARRPPSILSLSRPWDPFLTASPIPRVTVNMNQELARRGNGTCYFVRHVVDRLIGPGSVLKAIETIVLPFVAALTPLNVFGVWIDENGSNPSSLLSAIEEMTNRTTLKAQLGQQFRSEERAATQIERFNHMLDVLDAIDHYAVRMALDACALLGGVELPTWPPSIQFAGTWIEEFRQGSAIDPAQYIGRCRAKDLERWGVPCWMESPRSMYVRLESTPEALPTRDREAERRHQWKLQNIPRDRVENVYIPCVVRPVKQTAVAGGLPSIEAWADIKSAIKPLIGTAGSASPSFYDFSCQMDRLLGQAIWRGTRYEAHQHSNESMCWLKARDGAQESCHYGVIIASMEIPDTWSSPHYMVADKDGVGGIMPGGDDVASVEEPAVLINSWFVVEIAGYSAERQDEASRIALSYGALGHRFVQAPQQLKDAEGRSIPRSRYQVEVLFKSRRQQQDSCRQIQRELASNELTVSSVTMDDFGYDRLNTFHLVADPHYINRLYSRSLSQQARRSLLRRAPRYPVPPTAPTDSGDLRSTSEAVYLWRLVHFGLFEYDYEFLLPGYSPARADSEYAAKISIASSSTPRTATKAKPSPVVASSRTSLPVAELPLERLGEIAFAPSLPLSGKFSEEDANRLRRLYLCLCIGTQRAPFTAPVFSFPGSPYRRLLAAVAGLVEESSRNGIMDYAFHEGPANSSAGKWDEKLSLDKNRRVRISMDHSVEAAWDETRDPPRVEAYVARCIELPGSTRLQKKRRKRDAERKAKGGEEQGDISGEPASVAPSTSDPAISGVIQQ